MIIQALTVILRRVLIITENIVYYTFIKKTFSKLTLLLSIFSIILFFVYSIFYVRVFGTPFNKYINDIQPIILFQIFTIVIGSFSIYKEKINKYNTTGTLIALIICFILLIDIYSNMPK